MNLIVSNHNLKQIYQNELDGLMTEFKIPDDWKSTMDISVTQFFKSSHLNMRQAFMRSYKMIKEWL